MRFWNYNDELEIPYADNRVWNWDDERTCSECGTTVRRHSFKRDAYVPCKHQDPKCELNCGTWKRVRDKNRLPVDCLLEAPVEEKDDE